MDSWASGTWATVANLNFSPTSSFVRYVLTYTIPNDGTIKNLHLSIQDLAVSALSENTEIACVMLNEGPAPAAFQTAGNNIQAELEMCQRYYETGSINTYAYGTPGVFDIGISTPIYFKTIKRISPTVARTGVTFTTHTISGSPINTDLGLVNVTISNMMQKTTVGGSGAALHSVSANWTAEAEL